MADWDPARPHDTVTSVITYTGAGSRRGASLDESGQRPSGARRAGSTTPFLLARPAPTRPQRRAALGAGKIPYSTTTTYMPTRHGDLGDVRARATRTGQIKSIGSTLNPTGPEASWVTRTLYADVTIQAPPYSSCSSTTRDKH